MSIQAVDPRSRAMRNQASAAAPGLLGVLGRCDRLLALGTFAAVGYGLWAINGISAHAAGGSAADRQGLYAAVGIVLMIAIAFLNPDLGRRYGRAIYVALCGVMALVLVFGAATNGSTRWIDLGFFTFQPSEFGKVGLAVFLASYLADRAKQTGTLGVSLRAIAYALVPIALVFVQPDVGTALVYIAVLAAVLFISGARWLHLAVIAGIAVVTAVSVLWLLPAAGVNVLQPYQTARLTGFTHPSSNPNDSTSYNLNQSMIAVGSGGLEGRGIAGATQTLLNYLPESTTDFAFASLAEQRGFVGAAVLLLLYMLVVWRGLRIVAGAGDLFGALVAGGIVFGFLFQVFVNVGMTLGIAPITGIPLPFVSVGGSSMISNLIGMGILQAVASHSGTRRG